MRARNIYLLLLASLFAASCTTIQPRNVSDELYDTPSRETQKVYIAQSDPMEKDTSKDLRSSRQHDIQGAPYGMYERYPYHPYYYDPFDFYYPYGFYPRYYSFYPHYGWGFGLYPYASWYGYNWYGSWYSPYYYPYQYGTVKNYQRKFSARPSLRSDHPLSSHTKRYRKTPQIQDKQGTTRVRKYIRQEPQRQYTPQRNYTPPKRYIRATESLRPLNIKGSNKHYVPNRNIHQRKSSVGSFHRNIGRSTPVYRPPAKVRINPPVRSSSSSGRKRR